MFVAIFIFLNLINVILGTLRSILTIKASKNVASLINAISFTFYAGVIKMIAGQEMWLVLLTTFIANIVGVQIAFYLVKKFSKDKLWKIEVTIPIIQENRMFNDCRKYGLVYNRSYIGDEDYCNFNFYCSTQEESLQVKKILKDYQAKYFVTESKNL